MGATLWSPPMWIRPLSVVYAAVRTAAFEALVHLVLVLFSLSLEAVQPVLGPC